MNGNAVGGESSEIAAAVKRHPAVQDAVVIHGWDAKDARLVAYVVPDRSKAFPVHQLLEFQRRGLLKGRSIYELPNGMTIVHQNKIESDFLYREIFEDDFYLSNGVQLNGARCIIDVALLLPYALWIDRRESR